MQNLAKSVDCFSQELERAKNESLSEQKVLEKYLQGLNTVATKVAQYTNSLLLPEDNKETVQKYLEEQRSETGRLQDASLPLIKRWLERTICKAR